MEFGSIAGYILGLNMADLIGVGIVAGLGIVGYRYGKKILDAIVGKI